MFIGIQPIVDDFSEIIGCLIAFDERSSVFISGRLFSSAFMSVHQRLKISGTINDPIASDANVLGYRPR
jgi:hypothetical protein